MLATTLDVNCFTRVMLETTQDANYSFRGMLESGEINIQNGLQQPSGEVIDI